MDGEEAESAVGRRKGRPSDPLRLTTPVVFGRLHVLPGCLRTLAAYPEGSIDLVMKDGFTDQVEEGIRPGHSGDEFRIDPKLSAYGS